MTVVIDGHTFTVEAPTLVWCVPVTITITIIPVLCEVESTAEVLLLEDEVQL